MSLVAEQFRSLPINVAHIEQLSMISFSFVYDTELEYTTPCWINIINLCALDLLSNKTGSFCSRVLTLFVKTLLKLLNIRNNKAQLTPRLACDSPATW